MTEFFTVRVYGVFINHRQEILLSDEIHHGKRMTKFVGGGVKLGEGLHEALRREWKEELGVDVKILEHLYTTDFFQASAFDPKAQVLSVYYRLRPVSVISASIKRTAFDFEDEIENKQSVRWMPMDEFSIEEMTFKIDQHVAALLIDQTEDL